MKKTFSFAYKLKKKEVRNLRIVTVYEEVTITGEATKGWASNPVTEKSEPWYCVDIESVLWRNTNVYPLLQMVADAELDDIQEAAEQYARTLFSQPKETEVA